MDQFEKAGWARLEGPNTDTVHAEDAAHWRSVYRELVATMDRLLESARERLAARTGGDGALTPEGKELALLESRADYFQKRLLYWSTLEEEAADSA
jgi:hypothetical protein